jgi:hypothetical protein
LRLTAAICPLAFIPGFFFKALETDGYQLTERVRAQVGPQLKVLARVNRLMKSGQALEVTRFLAVTELVEHQPRLVSRRWHAGASGPV